MTQTIAILGRQPALGLAELESLYGSAVVQPIGSQAALLDADPATIAFERLGGTIKLARHITTFNTTDWPQLIARLTDVLPPLIANIPPGKIRFGLSVYGLPIKPDRINKTGLEIKKSIKKAGRSVRMVPNNTPQLNTAQLLHNQLTGPTGIELLFIKHGEQTVLGQTMRVQDINAYAARDQARPKRDARVGMLPPKLAQIIVNLATGKLEETGVGREEREEKPGVGNNIVLDPFCGTGVVLQEALLMGYGVYGTDVEPRMIEYSQANLAWLTQNQPTTTPNRQLAQGDATTYAWDTFTALASETYLGRPFSALPAPHVLAEVMQAVNIIHGKFLQNVARQTKPGFRMCLAVPAWKTPHGFKHLEILANLTDMGYNHIDFVHALKSDLIYHRDNQIVGRELVVLTRA